MELKAFKGMPHEFGGIDYTEGSEVEGGEFAVQIGKSGNEYIFDKNSSEGERLSKEYKKLDKNGRLTEDDPLALETFDQIAREEALKHAQRSVNEKGIDPFRNMYDQAGQAANGGVKYATGGPMMNPAEVPNVNPGAQYNTSMSYAPKTMEEHQRQTLGESRMRDSFGTQTMREQETDKAFKEIGKGKEFGMLMGDIFLNQFVTPVTGKSFSELEMGRQGYTSSDATKRAVGDDTMTGTAFGYGFAESEGVISNMGTQFFNMTGGSGGGDMMGMIGGMMGADGGAMPKDKYSMGGGVAGGGVDGLLSNAGVSAGGAGGGMGASGYLTLFEAIHNFRQGLKGAVGPALDEAIANNMGEEYVRKPIAGQPTTSNSNIGNLFGGMDFSKSKRGKVGPAPATALGRTKQNTKQEEEQPILDQGESFGLQPSAMNLKSYKGEGYLNPYMPSTDYSSNPMFANPNRYSDVTMLKNGGAKPIYGYYADGGGKKKEDKESFIDKVKGYAKDFAEPYVDFAERNRGLADVFLEPHEAQYLYTMFGGTEPFTEKQLSDEKISTFQDILENRTVQDKWKNFVTKENNGETYDDKKWLGYDDYNRFDAAHAEKILNDPEHFIKAFTHDPSILKFLAGKASVQEFGDAYQIRSDYDFAKQKAWEDLEGADYIAYLWNMSPYADAEAMSVQKGPNAPINITIPKRKIDAKKTNPYYNTTSSYPSL